MIILSNLYLPMYHNIEKHYLSEYTNTTTIVLNACALMQRTTRRPLVYPQEKSMSPG